jgi:hypothetical protein
MTDRPDLPWARVAEQRDIAVAALKIVVRFGPHEANPCVLEAVNDALACIAALDPPPAYTGPDRRNGERRSNGNRFKALTEWGLDPRKADRRKPSPDADGWIEWRGGECPVPSGVRIEIRLRNGVTGVISDPRRLRWAYHLTSVGLDNDIIAYRIVEGER